MEEMVSVPALYLDTGPQNRVITNTRMRKFRVIQTAFTRSLIAL